MNELPEERKTVIASFLDSVDMDTLYMQYNQGNDRWNTCFADIFRLEQEIARAIRCREFSWLQIREVMAWSGCRDLSRVLDAPDPITLHLYDGDRIAPYIAEDPVIPVRMIGQLTGFGPTSASRILRFALPSVYGVMDSRILRVFGNGDPASARVPLIGLSTGQDEHGRWVIGWRNWSAEYTLWLAALRHIATQLNEDHIFCPQPKNFVNSQLRRWGTWIPADVEMALHAYAAQEIRD